MESYSATGTWTGMLGEIVPADGNYASGIGIGCILAGGFRRRCRNAKTPARCRRWQTRLRRHTRSAKQRRCRRYCSDRSRAQQRATRGHKSESRSRAARTRSPISRRRRRRASQRNSPHPPGAPVLARLAVRLVESERHELASAVRVAFQRRSAARRHAAVSVRHEFLSGIRLVVRRGAQPRRSKCAVLSTILHSLCRIFPPREPRAMSPR